jgi:cyclic pyranopterin phosphate synthase
MFGAEAEGELTVTAPSDFSVEDLESRIANTIAALTLYDMGKAISHDIVIKDIRLLEKTGGKSDFHAP